MNAADWNKLFEEALTYGLGETVRNSTRDTVGGAILDAPVDWKDWYDEGKNDIDVFAAISYVKHQIAEVRCHTLCEAALLAYCEFHRWKRRWRELDANRVKNKKPSKEACEDKVVSEDEPCLTEDTEIYTRAGWRSVANIAVDVSVFREVANIVTLVHMMQHRLGYARETFLNALGPLESELNTADKELSALLRKRRKFLRKKPTCS